MAKDYIEKAEDAYEALTTAIAEEDEDRIAHSAADFVGNFGLGLLKELRDLRAALEEMVNR